MRGMPLFLAPLSLRAALGRFDSGRATISKPLENRTTNSIVVPVTGNRLTRENKPLRRRSDCLPRALAHGSDQLKIVFSWKGFDRKSGGAPSPIIDGAMFNLPIPSGKYPSESTYRELGLGEVVSMVSKRCAADTLCHEDPMFYGGRCAFGQTGISQYHLENNNVKEGDVFLFFGLFAELGSKDQAMNNQMPMAVWRAGMDKIETAARAVDMPLRLDNANALPTYPSDSRISRRNIIFVQCARIITLLK
jgi:hypothetical protein